LESVKGSLWSNAKKRGEGHGRGEPAQSRLRTIHEGTIKNMEIVGSLGGRGHIRGMGKRGKKRGSRKKGQQRSEENAGH